MTNEEIKQSVTELFPATTYEEGGEFLNIITESGDFRQMIEQFRNQEPYKFDHLFCLTCVDWKTHLTMVYHLLSKKHNHTIVLKVNLKDLDNPTIPTICDLWKGANFHEREVFDLFGVKFTNHPDMRRILLDEDWDGYPLRKNYVDENMVEI